MRRRDAEGNEPLARRQATQVGNTDLDHERAARLEVLRGVLEAGDLCVLRRQVVDRRNVPSARIVAMSPIVTEISAPPGFARSCSTIGSDRSMPDTATP